MSNCLQNLEPTSEVPQESRLITLTDGGVTLIDAEDFEFISRWKWRRNNSGYVCCTANVVLPDGKTKRQGVFMHRVIMKTPKGLDTHHRNGDKLDNRKGNLRICTTQENASCQVKMRGGSSAYKGVTWHKRDKRWQASIKVNYRYKHLGYFKNEEDAACAYNAAALAEFGEFAFLNRTPAAVALMCQNANVRKAMAVAGTPCAGSEDDYALDSVSDSVFPVAAGSPAKH